MTFTAKAKAVGAASAWRPVTPTPQAHLVFDAATRMAEPSPLSLKTRALDVAAARGRADGKD